VNKNDEEALLRSVALQNATSILAARQRAEERSEFYLAEGQRLSHTGSFGWRPATGELFWSEETFRIFQYDPATKPTVERALQRVHPEDVALVRETIERAAQKERDFDFEYRLLMPDGSVRHVHIVARASRDESGAPEFAGAVMDVTDQHQARAALEKALDEIKKSERQLQLAVDTIPTMVWSVWPDGEADLVNRPTLEYLGYTAEDLRRLGWQKAFHPDDAPTLEAWGAAMAAGKPYELEFRVRRRDGAYRWFLIRGAPLRDEQGKIERWYGTSIDIEDRKRAEMLLAGEKRVLEMIARDESLAGTLDALCRLAEELAAGSLSSILVLDPRTRQLRHGAAPSLPASYSKAIDGSVIGPSVGSCGTAAYRAEPVIVADIVTDPLWAEFRDLALAHGLRACWSTPILSSRGEVLGTFATYYREPRSPTAEEHSVMERFTQIASIALEGEQAEDALREQARLLDLTHDTVFVRDMNDTITYWNRGAEELYGWKAAEAVGKVAHQLLQTAFPEPLEKITDTLLRAGRWEGEIVHTTRDGTRVTVASRWALRQDGEGRPVAILETNNDVTERRQAEEGVRRQASLLEQTHDAILVWRVPGTIVYWNRGAERLYGFSRAEAIGRNSHDLLRTEHAMPAERFETLMERDGAWTGELTHRTRDGRRVVVDSRHVLVREADGGRLVLETNRDITDRKRAEYLTEHVFEGSPDAVTIVGADYRLQRVNPVSVLTWGLPAERMVGRHVRDIVGMDTFAKAKPYLDRCFDGEDVSFAGWFTMPPGRRHVVVTFSPLRPQSDRVEAALVISRDITEQTVASEALGEAQAQLAHVTRVTTLGEVTASLAHEVNQPLAAIVNNANACLGLLPSGRDLEEVREALADIVSDGERASAIIERVRGLAKRSSPQKVPLRLTDVVADVVALAAAESATRRVAIATDVGPDLPVVLGDRVQLQQVLLNLVVNGMDAMSAVAEGERRLEIRGRADSQDGSPAALLSVEDRGIGLEAGQADSVFEAFYTTKPHGMGMGLAISRSIIEAHGGRLWAQANQGPGATFAFSLPVLADDAAP
jgi:PAS domain S-box-containing protein